ncbi:MAG: LLM class F420-dependent oxidoreductase [Bacteroidales bacterium]|nr:LLM class F420-dependent oxidoreductase [Bacteroidales bacterium]
MEINVTLPFDNLQHADQFLVPEAVTEIAQLLEELGFSGGNVTDHPCPTGRWLDAGGHHAQDPFVMLSFVAAATRTFKLQTGILVLPYRNPFLTARAVASLDRFSGGRLTLGLGAGYLKGEYRALGVDFDKRNDLMDEYLRALKAALSQDEFSFEGSWYEARGNRVLPGAVQKPHPPLLVGGNSPRAIRRAAELADGWYPFFTAGALSNTARTKAMEGEQDLIDGIRYLHEHCEKIGREDKPKLVVGSISPPGRKLSVQETVDTIGRLGELGVSCVALNIPGETRAEWCDNARRLAADVLAKLPKN